MQSNKKILSTASKFLKSLGYEKCCDIFGKKRVDNWVSALNNPV